MFCSFMKSTYFFSLLAASVLCAIVAAGCWDDDEAIPSDEERQQQYITAGASTNQNDPSNQEAHPDEAAPTGPTASSDGKEHTGDTAPAEEADPSNHETHSRGANASLAPIPYRYAPAPLRLKIFDSYAIIRATLIESGAEAELYSAEFGGPGKFPWGRWLPGYKNKEFRSPGFPDDSLPVDGEYRAVHTFRFRVTEYLKGSGASEITVRTRTNGTRGTEAEALQVATASLAERDTSRDTHEAILFLGERYRDGTAEAVAESSQPEGEFQFLLSGPYGPLQYTIDTLNRVWFLAKDPPAPAGTTSSTDDSALLFLTGNPSEAVPPTMSLGELRTEIVEVDALTGTGGDTEEHKRCVVEGWQYEHLFAGVKANGPFVPSVFTVRLASGAPEGTAVLSYSSGGAGYDRIIIDGVDKDLFKQLLIDDDNRSDNGYTVDDATARPLPAGKYQYNSSIQAYSLVPCNFITDDYSIQNVVVTAPEGTLHELFFDPVTVGSTVSADSTNGVLKPVSFTDPNGASATIGSIAWESGTVKVEVDPHTALEGQIVDIIELDGSVSLSLEVADATVDAVNDTLSWSVSSQPWEDGDKLMVRIREAPPSCKSGTAVTNPGSNAALVGDCETLLGLRDALAGTGSLNWGLDTAIDSSVSVQRGQLQRTANHRLTD